MSISDEKLQEIVLRVLQQIEAEKQAAAKKTVYLMCLEAWDERYAGFLGKSKCWKGENEPFFEICAFIPRTWRTNGNETLLKRDGICYTKTYEEAEGDLPKAEDITVYPVVPRYLLAKTALCMDDVFESRWLFHGIAQGSRAVFLSAGLDRLTGREPEAYRAKILSYIRSALEYGIEMQGTFDPRLLGTPAKLSGNHQDQSFGFDPKPFREPDSERRKRRIITAKDVEQAQAQGVITLYPGDQITDVAKDRAKFLKISVKRTEEITEP